jgi:DnaJ domain
LRTYYDLLSVAPGVSMDEIKKAFRREIARYHPDKVQHLGTEFQEIAAVRASELTEAYRILMDEEARRKYDETLEDEGGAPPLTAGAAAPVPTAGTDAARPRTDPAPEPAPASGVDNRFQKERATTSDFVRKAGVSRLRDAVAGTAIGTPVTIVGFDVAFDIKGKGGLFKKAEPPVRLLARFVPQVDAAAVEACWPLAVKAAKGNEPVYLLLLGNGGIAPARDLAAAIGEQRRKSRSAGPVLIPVDVRDWEALFPPEAPASVRAIVQWLRDAKS